MKILYYISVHGLAHYHERVRTGIYRVVINVLEGVVNSSEFTAWELQERGYSRSVHYLAGYLVSLKSVNN